MNGLLNEASKFLLAMKLLVLKLTIYTGRDVNGIDVHHPKSLQSIGWYSMNHLDFRAVLHHSGQLYPCDDATSCHGFYI